MDVSTCSKYAYEFFPSQSDILARVLNIELNTNTRSNIKSFFVFRFCDHQNYKIKVKNKESIQKSEYIPLNIVVNLFAN